MGRVLDARRPGLFGVAALAVGHDPVRYRELIKRPRGRPMPLRPPGTTGHPPSIDRPPRITLGDALTSATPVKWGALKGLIQNPSWVREE